MSAPVGVIGAGAWGTALAQVLAMAGHTVQLWSRNAAVVEAVQTTRENRLYLPGVPLSPAIAMTSDLSALAESRAVLVVTPAQHMRSVLTGLPAIAAPLILCSKGIEAGSLKLMHQVAAEAVPGAPIAVLSGPTFAHEVARGQPTAVTLAAADAALAGELAGVIALPTFRPYVTDDVTGAEVGGAVKNVLAIACGVVEGAGLGQNARAALIARGFAEMTRFGLALGARAETLAGLSGLGDLVLTCSSTSSRNFSLGLGLGRGQRATDLLTDRRTVAEGASTAPVLAKAARAAGVEMPVVDAVCALLNGSDVAGVIGALLARPLRPER
ncbi:NAD(P)-dependent glycerol-3-phosphate dehydrogenase [Sphingomonas sp. BGYR3]|uniref:NAD(P)H-dependent glycerol-3-phosphate dehydrogenase n=1 Tax=Sphingomonas sp. BGYR3 TaxID=2975483 RepID=UPI0021A75EF6|nr:NAD(P)H-dependent glycerol-3-phosphate dehydrogenase [Sphingomonas sp. BGYR3]MDG5488514.1 NAD(P)-dependent glycerol-3-phosphate dehydrogenase [Sphingomonas sp. BGYR3]